MNTARKFPTARLAYSLCAANNHHHARAGIHAWAMLNRHTRARAGRGCRVVGEARSRFYVITGERV